MCVCRKINYFICNIVDLLKKVSDICQCMEIPVVGQSAHPIRNPYLEAE